MDVELLKAVEQVCSGLFSEFGPDIVIRAGQIQFSGVAECAVQFYASGVDSVGINRNSGDDQN